MLHLNACYTFADTTTTVLTNEWKRGGITVLADISSSIVQENRLSEVKLAVSAVAALTGFPGRIPLPAPGGSTALADAAEKISSGLEEEDKLLVITDGMLATHRFSVPTPL